MADSQESALKLRWFIFILFFQAPVAWSQNTNTASTAVEGPSSETSFSPKSESSRLEELLIWKVSEDLHLSVPDEKRISDMIHELDQKKQEKAAQIEQAQKNLETATSDVESKKKLKDYREALRAYNQISVEEVDRVQKILKSPVAAQYFVVKGHLSRRIRNLLGGTSNHGDAVPRERGHIEKLGPLSDPKIIEE